MIKSRKNWLQREILVACTLAVPLIGGCIAVPIEAGEDEPFQEDQLAFLEVGITTKQDVNRVMPSILGDPESQPNESGLEPKTYRGGKTWLYGKSRREMKWEMISVDRAGINSIGTSAGVDFRLLLLDFDASGVLEERKLLKLDGGCSKEGVCAQQTGRGIEFLLLATAAEESEALSKRPAANQCMVYLFGDLKGRNTTLSVNLDGEDIGTFLNNEHYFLVTLDEGSHNLWSDVGLMHLTGPVEFVQFECPGGKNYYLQLKAKRKYWSSPANEVEFIEIDKDAASKLLRSRRLTLLEDQDVLAEHFTRFRQTALGP